MPDAKWGERLKAFIVVESDEQFEDDQVISYCQSKLARFKVPREFEIIDELPRNNGGKLLKKELREKAI